MIDLRKPLSGVPGLLLLAVLVLFGATIGVSLALVFSLVEMKDSLANFLGGVVGAGLGSALAVMGAVYVQRQERRDRLAVHANRLIARLQEARLSLDLLRGGLNQLRELEEVDEERSIEPAYGAVKEASISLLKEARRAAAAIPDGSQFSWRQYIVFVRD